MPSLAQSLPQELFAPILESLPPTEEYYPFSATAKAPFSLCGRVCRYWARICRPKLFETIKLRSAEDMLQFATMLKAPPLDQLDPIASLVFCIDAFSDGKAAPWLHQGPNQVLSRLHTKNPVYNVNFGVSFTPSTVGGPKTLSSLYPCLPRSLPTSYWGPTHLHLSGVHFRRGAELCRLITGTPSLVVIALTNLSWIVPPVFEDFISLSSSAKVLSLQCTAAECTPLPARWFLPSLIGCWSRLSERKPQSILDTEDLEILGTLRDMFQACYCEVIGQNATHSTFILSVVGWLLILKIIL